MITEKKESHPLAWPGDWPRTRPQDQRAMNAWKRTATQYRDQLADELGRMKARSFVISSNVPLNARGAMTVGLEPRDVGVAVYFSRPRDDDFTWQDALGIKDPYPTEDQIADAFKRLAQVHHPDRVGGDIELFRALTRHRDNALRWLRQTSGQQFDYVIACDQFSQVRWNLAAIGLTIKAIRQIERCGTTSLLERAFKGFAAALPEHVGAAQ